MKTKKNPKKDLSKNSSIYFVAGLALVLCCTYIALEWKSFSEIPYHALNEPVEQELIEEIELFEIEKITPPKPAVIPDVIEIIEDIEPMEESPIESTEGGEEIEILDAGEVDVFEEPEDVIIPFSVIENVPVFPGCENEKDKRDCFNAMMKKHIIKNFKYPELEQEMGIQGRVSVMFEIQKDGSIGNIRMRGPNKNLENDAKRIISKLPKMTPGKQRGNAVRVPFSIPITYKLQ